jgi:hypothetical protein
MGLCGFERIHPSIQFGPCSTNQEISDFFRIFHRQKKDKRNVASEAFGENFPVHVFLLTIGQESARCSENFIEQRCGAIAFGKRLELPKRHGERSDGTEIGFYQLWREVPFLRQVQI